MSPIVRAFPWLRQLRRFRVTVEPAIGIVFLAVALPSVAAYGMWSVSVFLVGAVAIATTRFVPWLSLALALFAGYLWTVGSPLSLAGGVLAQTAIVVILVGAFRRPIERWAVLGAAVVAGLLLGNRIDVGSLGASVLLAGAWGMGTAIGEAAARVRAVGAAIELGEELDASRLEFAVTAERERVAQEVHDVVAHSLAVILAQAEGARALSTKRPAAMSDALERIADASRSALLDVRGIVDGLTGGVEPPQSSIADLPDLLRGVEEAGVAVRSASAGEPRELGAAQETAVYRIVQEGATNAIRHRGRGSALDVVLDWRGPGLSIQIVSTGAGDAVPAPGAGRGIPGMTDRARIAGGWLAAGEDETGDHRITAFVPFREVTMPTGALETVPA